MRSLRSSMALAAIGAMVASEERSGAGGLAIANELRPIIPRYRPKSKSKPNKVSQAKRRKYARQGRSK